MKVSYNWLKEYLDLSQVDVNELAERITLTGIEVESIEQGEEIDDLVVGEVLECSPIEDSDHLNLTQVDVGEAEPYQIVCGAPNVRAGIKVVTAKPGAVLPGNFEIKTTKMMGNESNGMICSLDELGFTDSVIPKFAEKGIYILPDHLKAGSSASKYLGLDDSIIEFDVTPNRADVLSMRGTAHEVAAILNQVPTFDKPKVDEGSENVEDYISVKVEDEKDAPIYKMRLIKNAKIGTSPLWLQKKLMAAGMRPIDSIVDITNYVMLEYGQPLHAFDYDKLNSKEILVRRAEDGEDLQTLDGKDRKLSNDNLVITNGKTPVGLAGVMGGANSIIDDDTTTIALESAVFNSALIRRTANQMDLRSEASSRYEKGINLAVVQEAVDFAAQLMVEIAGGEVVSGTESVEHVQAGDSEIIITIDYINKLIGDELTAEEVETIFGRLGFTSERTDQKFIVSVPPRRWDISIPADLVEEVARIHGYNNIPSTLPFTESVPGELNDSQRITRHLRDSLEAAGLSQAISYALTTEEKAKLFRLDEEELVKLDHPMSVEHHYLRQSIAAGLLDDAEYNNARQMKDIFLYEIGRVFYKDSADNITEKDHISGIISGSLVETSWIEKDQQVDFFTMKGIVEELLASLGLTAPVRFESSSDWKEMHPGRTARVLLGNESIGFIGQIHPKLATERDLDETYLFELNLDALVKADKDTVVYNTIPKYPGTSRDVALLVDEEVKHDDVMRVIEAHAGQELQSVRLFDIYQGENIEDGKKSLAYSLYYLNPEKTLKDEEVDTNFQSIQNALKEELQVEIR